jgi:hypothetical protein
MKIPQEEIVACSRCCALVAGAKSVAGKHLKHGEPHRPAISIDLGERQRMWAGRSFSGKLVLRADDAAN